MKWLESSEYQSMPSYRLVTARIFWFGDTAEQPLKQMEECEIMRTSLELLVIHFTGSRTYAPFDVQSFQVPCSMSTGVVKVSEAVNKI